MEKLENVKVKVIMEKPQDREICSVVFLCKNRRKSDNIWEKVKEGGGKNLLKNVYGMMHTIKERMFENDGQLCIFVLY